MTKEATESADHAKKEEKLIVHEIQRFTNRINTGAAALQGLTVLIAACAIILSLTVATYSGSEKGFFTPQRIKHLAFLSAVFTGIYTGFHIRTKAAHFRDAYRILRADLMRYRIGEIKSADLINTYSKAEILLGHIEVEGVGGGEKDNPPRNS